MLIAKRTAQAEQDLIEIWLYIAQDNPDAADRMLDELESKFQLLSEQPYLGPARPDIAQEMRFFPVGSYLILYREVTGGVEIVRVVHGARKWMALF
jgi:toxin ParE1/3/4